MGGSDADDGASGADGAGGDGGRSRWAGARTRGAARGPGSPRGPGRPGGRGRGERAFFCRGGTGAVRAACAPAPARRARSGLEGAQPSRTVLFQDAPAHRGASCGKQTRPALCPAPMPRSCAPSQALSTPARSSHAVWLGQTPSRARCKRLELGRRMLCPAASDRLVRGESQARFSRSYSMSRVRHQKTSRLLQTARADAGPVARWAVASRPCMQCRCST